jgi:F0F1-type ATP synthase assembly protein I
MADEGPGNGTENSLGGRDLAELGGLLVGAVVGGLVLGLLLDHVAGTSPVFTLIGIFLGIVCASVGFWVRVRAALRD